jgi:hypothetical protein
VALIAAGFKQLNDEQGLYDYFQASLRRHGGVSLALAFADVISNRDGVPAAEKFIVDWLRRTPNVHGLHKLLELNLVKASDSGRNDLLLLKGIIEDLRSQHLGYACGQCGFKGKALHWLCPAATAGTPSNRCGRSEWKIRVSSSPWISRRPCRADFAEQLSPAHCRLKVGMELFTAAGPKVVENLVSRGFDVFLDLKYHDIPTTVARACTQAASLGVWMLNVHVLGGRKCCWRRARRLIVWPAARC